MGRKGRAAGTELGRIRGRGGPQPLVLPPCLRRYITLYPRFRACQRSAPGIGYLLFSQCPDSLIRRRALASPTPPGDGADTLKLRDWYLRMICVGSRKPGTQDKAVPAKIALMAATIRGCAKPLIRQRVHSGPLPAGRLFHMSAPVGGGVSGAILVLWSGSFS